jgi:PKD repeat protein
VIHNGGGGTATDSHTYNTPGVYVVRMTVSDNYGGSSTLEHRYVVVYDPEGGFVTGGGWIDSPSGAYYPEPELTGKANFGFVSKYKKGTTTPTGDTEFRFKAADLDFRSSDYEWLVLVVAGSKGQFKGVGTINGEGAYNFILTAIDGDLNGNDNFEADRFRMRIWSEDELANEHAVYDNGFDADNFDDENLTSTTTELGGGSIVIHQVKGNN